MPSMDLKLEGDTAWADLAEREIIEVPEEAAIGVIVLPGGMASGQHSVAFRFDLPDGRVAIAQTSLNLFQSAARATAARYGWVEDREAGITPIDGSRRTR